MRKYLLLAAAVPLILAPPAVAGTDEAKDNAKEENTESVCRVPDIDLSYDTERFSVLVSLPASGCKSREHRIFTLSAMISRLDNSGGRDVTDWSVDCGPFRAASDNEPGTEAPQYFCDLGVNLDHPQVETAQYDIEVTYPGAAAERTTRLFTFCTSDGKTGACEG